MEFANLNLNTLLTGLLVSGLTAIITSYISGKIHEVQIKHLEEAMRDLKDKEIKDMKHEIERIRTRLHDWASKIGWIDQRMRYNDLQFKSQGDTNGTGPRQHK